MTLPEITASKPRDVSKFLVLLCVSVPSFMINLDGNIVAVSLPTIANSLHADFSAIEWVISSYMLAFASLVLPAGSLADRYGRKAVLIAGLALFTAASFVCGAAPSALILNISRAFQGVGAALLLSSALATLSHEFRGAERAKAFAFWGSVIGIAITLGPIIGGLITQWLGWQWAFYINIPVGLIMIALTITTLEESRDPGATSIDILGVFLFAGSLFCLTLALISGNHAGWGSPYIVLEFGIAFVLFALFLVAETTLDRPMLDLSFFKRSTYVGANVAGLAYAGALLTMLTYLPLYFQGVLGFDPQDAGLAMLPLAFPLFLVPRIVAAFLTQRFSGRSLLTFGLAVLSLGMVVLFLGAYRLGYWWMLPGLLTAGIGAGVLNGETAKVSMTVIPPERAGMAAGVGGTVRFTGIVVGIAALGAILFTRVSSSLGQMLPNIPEVQRAQITQAIISGDIGPSTNGGVSSVLIRLSLGSGYQALFLTSAVIAGAASIAAWMLVKSADTAPHR